MNLIIIGGFDEITYSTVKEAQSKGIQTTTLYKKDQESEHQENINHIDKDIFAVSEDELYDIFKSGKYDAIIYIPHLDINIPVQIKTYDYLHKNLIEECAKVFRAARRADIQKAILVSTYFLYFEKKFPKKRLSQHHPYIRVKKEQAAEMIHIGMDENGSLPPMDVSIVEIPFVFGVPLSGFPMWREILLDKIARGKKVILFPNGGSVMSSSDRIGEVLIGAVEHGKGGEYYTAGDENHDYNWMLNKLLQGVQGKPMKIWNLPKKLIAIYMNIKLKRMDRRKGIHQGFDYYHLVADVLSDYFYYPQNEIDDTNEALHIKKSINDVEDSIIKVGSSSYQSGEWK